MCGLGSGRKITSCFQAGKCEEVGGILHELGLGRVVVELKELGCGQRGREVLEVVGEVLEIEPVNEVFGQGYLRKRDDLANLSRSEI